MGFFSDLKEDLSQAVNELMPEENLDQAAAEELKEQPVENTQEPLREEIPEAQTAEDAKDNVAFEEMLKNLDSIEIPQEQKTEEFQTLQREYTYVRSKALLYHISILSCLRSLP